MLAHQEPSGAFLASRDFAPYHYCWLRDGSFVAFALGLAGEQGAAERFHRWVARSICGISGSVQEAVSRRQAGGSNVVGSMPPARFAVDGAVCHDDWPNFQVDGYGTWLWSLWEHISRFSSDGLIDELAPSVELAVAYLEAVGLDTCFDCWEENADAVHTSTLGCVYGGLRAAGSLLGSDKASRRADDVRGVIESQMTLEGRFVKSSVSTDVDASLLWLAVPFGATRAGSPAMAATAEAVAESLVLDGGTRRYPGDTYYGGGAWPLLTAWLGWYRSATGDLAEARRCQAWVEACFDPSGRLPEQCGGRQRDAASYNYWVARWGPPAADLAWSHAMYFVLWDQLQDQAVLPSPGDGLPAARAAAPNPPIQ